MKEPSLAATIDAWTREALAKSGDDWSQISEHIARRMAALPPAEKHAIKIETALTLMQTAETAKH